MNYIQEITERIEVLLLEDKDGLHPIDHEVYEYYALLVLTVGVNCTNENVHDAWVIWAIKNKPDHLWVKPFREIPYSIQLLDCKFRDIIIQVAKEHCANVVASLTEEVLRLGDIIDNAERACEHTDPTEGGQGNLERIRKILAQAEEE